MYLFSNSDGGYCGFQVSSSEYFSVSFEVGHTTDDDEFVVAAKGTSLA